jgi:hypothetical protein
LGQTFNLVNTFDGEGFLDLLNVPAGTYQAKCNLSASQIYESDIAAFVAGSSGGGGSGITYIQSQTTAIFAAGNNTATFSAQPATGNTVVAGIVCYGPTGCPISSITDNLDNSYTQVGPTASYGGPATNVTNVALYCASGILSGSNFTVTATLGNSGSGDSNLYIAEYSGLTCTVDQSASGSLTDGTPTTLLQTSSATTTNSSDLLVAVSGATTGGVATAGSGYQLRQNGNSGAAEYGGFEDQTVTATGSYSGSMTLASSTSSWAMVMVGLKGSAGGAPPTITSFTPTSGLANTSVTITGTNFTGATAVRFNGTAATSFTVNSATQVSATVPTGATTGHISVTTPSGTGTSTTNFTVTTSSGGITYIQSQEKISSTGGSPNAQSATFSAQPTAGDTVVVGLVCWASAGCQITSVADNFSNTYTQIGTTTHYLGTNADVALYCASGISSASNFQVTATLTNTGGDSDLYIAEYSGLTCNVDQTASGSGSTSTTSLQTSSVTTTNATDLLVAVAGSTIGNAATAGSGYTLRQNDNSGTAEYGGFEDRTVTATGSYSGSMTVAVSTSGWGMAMAALKGSSSGGAAPTITSFTPTSGPVNTSVTITGTNLTGATSVKFNGTPATTFNVNSSTQIVATVSPTATTGPISVTTPSGTATSTGSFTITVPAPTVTNFAPTSGSVGASVTITGTTLTGATAVTFNGIAAAAFSVSSSTQIVATVSSTATSGPISVTTPAGTGSSTGSFTVVPSLTSLSPTSGPSGTAVTITGTGFGSTRGSSTVTFNGTAATSFPTWNATTISTTVPSGATTGPVVVTVGGVPSNRVNFAVQGTNSFSFTGSLNTGRYAHTATMLNNGTVLIAGGWSGSILASAELYDPATGTFTATGSLNAARASHTATLLNNGMVLIVGGNNNGTNDDSNLASAELYNPATGTFTATGSLNTARAYHTATLLGSGGVLITGGFTNGSSNSTDVILSSAEVYNPATGTFTAMGGMNAARTYHTATLLNNGTALIVGGCNGSGCGNLVANAELFNPATGNFTVTGGLNTGRNTHTSTLLNNGMVLVAGGFGNASPPELASAELYNPTTGTFATTGSLNTGRDLPTATLLNNGMVLVVGGFGNASPPELASAELYDPVAGTFAVTGSLNNARYYQTVTLLDDGMPLVVGSFGGNSASAELYQPSTFIPPGLVSIAVSPVNPTVAIGMAQQFVATGTFSGNTTQALASATWRSSSPIVRITDDAGNHGAAAALSLGSATVSACTGAVCGSTTMTTVSNPLGPTITSLSPIYGSVGTVVTITGTNFGVAQGTSTVTFGNKIATPSGSSSTCSTSWSDTCIVVPVPTGVPTGNLNVVVTVSNTQSNAVTFTDTVSQDFLISATPASQSASSGANAVYTVNVSPLNGFIGTVSLSVSGLPSGATAVFSPTTISGGSGSSTLTVSIPASAPTTTSTLIITGTSGSLTHLASAVLLANPPTIVGLSLPKGPPQMGFVITGTNFGATQGNSSVVLGGTNLIVVPGTWSPTSITVQAGVTSGNVIVIVGTAASNGVQFTVTGPFGCSTN